MEARAAGWGASEPNGTQALSPVRRYNGNNLMFGTAGNSTVACDTPTNSLDLDARIIALLPERGELVGIELRQESLMQCGVGETPREDVLKGMEAWDVGQLASTLRQQLETRRPPMLMKSINFRGQLTKLPKWFPILSNLTELTLRATELSTNEDLEVLARLPSLLYLTLHHGAYVEGEFVIAASGFPCLKLLVIHLAMFDAWKASFHEGALPRLGKLELSLFEQASIQEVSGIEFLPNLKEHQNAPDDALNRRLSALPLPTAPAEPPRTLPARRPRGFPLSWRPVHRLLAHLSARHDDGDAAATSRTPPPPPHASSTSSPSPATSTSSTPRCTPCRAGSSPPRPSAPPCGASPPRARSGRSPRSSRSSPSATALGSSLFVTDVACSTCRLPDVAEKVIKRVEHRHGVVRTPRCSELLVVAYCRAGALADACRVWNGMGRGGLEPGAAAYQEIVVTMFKNNRVADAMMVFDGMRRSGVPDAGGGCCRAVVSWLCKEGRVWGAYMVFAEMFKKGLEVDGEVLGGLVYGLMVRRRVREGYRVFHGAKERDIALYHGLMKGLIRIKRAGEATEGHLGKRGRKGRDPLVNFESIFVGGLVKAGRTLEATKFVERTMWGGVDVPRFDYNKFLYYFSNEEGVAMFEEVGKRLREVGLIDLGDILSTYGERMATRDRRRTAMNGLLGLVQDVSCQTSSKS
ncbi:hypothetical protein PR202_ga29298 [Eleusine coracana subsp. coracana]|uniref:Disease resistance R13L4/SHOC-2-like LRR domain-containing protein n=1 Tax=Eleusine coracana subsp. coracana TaxID=191504 RepID=A0AAV5DJ65_ELECO|nr:hypothetical protein PR202_ga29298 [Eleusine coracana subsp. coracana]